MLFDRSRELPIATVRRARHAKLAVLAGDLRRWLDLRWDWLRPRMVPVLVALASLFAVMQSLSYMARPPAFTQVAPAAIDAELVSVQHCEAIAVELYEP